MDASHENLNTRYEAAAGKWRDKMRALGYYDGYLGFLTEPGQAAPDNSNVVDVGAGTAAFAEAWVAVNGQPASLTLIEPSPAMANRGVQALNARGVQPDVAHGLLGEVQVTPVDEVLAAHVIEHCPDPETALSDLWKLVAPGGRLRLVVSKPHWCNAIIWLQWRHRTFSEKEILGLMEGAGFKIDATYAFPSGPPSRTSRGIVASRP